MAKKYLCPSYPARKPFLDRPERSDEKIFSTSVSSSSLKNPLLATLGTIPLSIPNGPRRDFLRSYPTRGSYRSYT